MAIEKNNMALKVAALAEKARDGNRMSFQELVSIFQEDIHRLVLLQDLFPDGCGTYYPGGFCAGIQEIKKY